MCADGLLMWLVAYWPASSMVSTLGDSEGCMLSNLSKATLRGLEMPAVLMAPSVRFCLRMRPTEVSLLKSPEGAMGDALKPCLS